MGNSFLTPNSSEPIAQSPDAALEPETLVAEYICSHPDHAKSGHTLLCRFIANLKA